MFMCVMTLCQYLVDNPLPHRFTVMLEIFKGFIFREFRGIDQIREI